MGRISILHTADLHLGSSFREVPPHIGRQRRRDLMQTLADMADLCRQNQTDLFLISGDLWDEHYITRPLVDFIADQFRRIPATRVVIAPGQADYNHKDSFYREYPWPENVYIFSKPELSSIWLPQLNTRVYGVAWADKNINLDWEQVAGDRDTGCQVIIIAYGKPESLNIPKAIMDMDNLAYVALGGSHRHTAWAAKVLDPGCPEPLGFSSPGSCGVLQGNVGAASGSLEFLALARRQFHTLSAAIDKCSSLDEVAAEIKEAINPLEPEKNLFKVHLAGSRPQGNWSLETIRSSLEEVFYLSIVDKTETSFDINSLAAEHSRGVVGRYISAVKGIDSVNEEIRKKALACGLDALLSGRVAQW